MRIKCTNAKVQPCIEQSPDTREKGMSAREALILSLSLSPALAVAATSSRLRRRGHEVLVPQKVGRAFTFL